MLRTAGFIVSVRALCARVIVAGIAVTGCITVLAQQPATASGKGAVTGRAILGDTHLPARLASVVLFGIPAELTSAPKPDPDGGQQAVAMQMAAGLKALSSVKMVQAQTSTDGTFTATDIEPGDYYVFGSTPGYISPMYEVQALLASGADMKKPLPGVPTVHVTADRTTSIDLEMPKAAAISGTVVWDDGSPVAGAVMVVLPAKKDAPPLPQQFSMLAMASVFSALSITDDLGRFRISSLAPGEYIVSATVRSGQQSGLGTNMNLSKMMSVTPLTLYGPSAWHKADAKPVTLHDGEDLRDEQITLNLTQLHTVSGRVAAVSDHHGINSGTVRLSDAGDKEFVRSGSLDAQGNFQVDFVPPGTYNMTVSDAEDTEPAKNEGKKKLNIFSDDKTLRSYQKGKLTVIVVEKNVTGQNVELAVDASPQEKPDFSKMMDELDTPDAK